MSKLVCVHRAEAVIQLHNSINSNKIIVKQISRATPEECLRMAAAKLVTAIQYPGTGFAMSACSYEGLNMSLQNLIDIYNNLASEECHCDEN